MPQSVPAGQFKEKPTYRIGVYQFINSLCTVPLNPHKWNVCRVAAARVSLEQELELLKTEQTTLHYALQASRFYSQ